MSHHKKATRPGPAHRCPARAGRAGRRRAPAGKAPAGRTPADWLESEERLRAILQTAVEAIITIDEQGMVESMNPAAERVFGWKAEEMLGRSVNLLMPSPYREEHDRYMANYLRTGQAKIIGIGREVVGQRKDGTVFPMDLAVSEVHLANRRLFTGFIRDITERKRLEREVLEITQRERQRIGQDLHDGLCQQLAAIELMSQVLEQKLASKSKVAAARAGQIAQHVRDAIGQTRALARGLSPVTLESEGLTPALMELAVNTEKLFGIRCRFEAPGNLVVRNVPVATQLYRIAQEAVSNAIKHGKANRLVISLQAEGDRIVLRVFDNGSGFPPAGPKPGGMGLRIMQYRAHMIGGALGFERNPEHGMTVSCSVPRASALPGATVIS